MVPRIDSEVEVGGEDPSVETENGIAPIRTLLTSSVVEMLVPLSSLLDRRC